MKNRTFFQVVSYCFLILAFVSCQGLFSSDSDDSTLSDESNVEAAYSGAIDAVSNSAVSSSTSEIASSVSSDYTTTSITRSHGAPNIHRINCTEPSAASETWSCDESTGDANRAVTYTDCVLTHSYGNRTLNGSFTNTVVNGGDEMCNIDYINFTSMVQGRDGANAEFSHETGDGGFVITHTNRRGHDVTQTMEEVRYVTYSEPTLNENDVLVSVVATVDQDNHRTDIIEGHTAHEMNVFTSDESFTSTASDGTATEVDLSYPVHTLNFDEYGSLISRVINSGQLVVDHVLAGRRFVFDVDEEEGLTFELGTCGPTKGGMLVVAYAINEDGSIGDVVGSGEAYFENGSVSSVSYEGEVINPIPGPCH